MRVEVLSEHPDVMLADAERERRRGVAEQLAWVESLREERGQARSEGRWLAWLRLAFTVSGGKREARRLHLASVLPTAQEQTMRAGLNAERRVASDLGEVLDDEWVLLRGYCNARGEIDALLLGPRGLFAIEEKYRSVRVYIHGDEWAARRHRAPHPPRPRVSQSQAPPFLSEDRNLKQSIWRSRVAQQFYG
jgi:hypothetical protein